MQHQPTDSMGQGMDAPPSSSPAQSTPPPLPFGPYTPPIAPPAPPIWERAVAWGKDYFLGRDPTFLSALGPMMLVSLILYTRWPATNYIFDEQEALLANPYVNASQGLRFVDAIHRDFWGLPAERSVGSYRPIPNFLWRSLWHVSHQPFFHSLYNVLFHAVNAAILTMIVWLWTRRRGTSYLTGFVFLTCAVLTEAVSGIVGIADVLGGMGALLALLALSLPAWSMPAGVFLAVVFGLFCKESALVCVPLIPVAAVVAAPLIHPERPQRIARGMLAFVASVSAFILYVELRKRWFTSPTPSELTTELPLQAGLLKWTAREFLLWFHQAPLPKDPLNNPLADADTPHRVAGALRVYARGFGQVLLPRTLSGDYSFPQEPAPDLIYFGGSIAGAFLTVFPLVAGFGLWIMALFRERAARLRTDPEMGLEPAPYRALVPPPSAPLTQEKDHSTIRSVALIMMLVAQLDIALELFYLRPHGKLYMVHGIALPYLMLPFWVFGLGLFVEHMPRREPPEPRDAPIPLERSALILVAIGLVWIVVSFFPHSNIPVVLPTVRAERFWYFPAIGSSIAIAAVWSALQTIKPLRKVHAVTIFCGAFLAFQSIQAYKHAMDYRDDLVFWAATKDAVPNSAKAHLNYSVMVGARNDLPARLIESKKAIALAPKWAMAHVYTGDTLCRMHKPKEAWPYYRDGFEIGPNELSLIALALQCMYDESDLTTHEAELRKLAEQHEGSWIAYLAVDTLNNSEKNKGVDPKYRPRGYNEGPKD